MFAAMIPMVNAIKATVVIHAPQILTAIGVGGLVTAGVMAAVKTPKAVGVIKEVKDNLEKIEELHNQEKVINENGEEVPVYEVYSEKDYKKDKRDQYLSCFLMLSRIYGLPIAIAVASASGIFMAMGIMSARNAMLVSMVGSLQEDLNEYRKEVRGELGEERERALYNKSGQEETKVTVKEDGTVETETKNRHMYTIVFDEHNPRWNKNAHYNGCHIKRIIREANDKLRCEKSLPFAWIQEAFDEEVTSTGMKTGWIYDEENPNGDNYVSCGLTELDIDKIVASGERSFVLNFNCDGYILDKMDLVRSRKHMTKY